MKKLIIISLALLYSFESADKIVQKADLKRGLGNQQHSFVVKIHNSNNKDETYQVKIKDNDTSLVIQTEPQKAIGRKLLMEKNDMWLFTPDIKKPIRLSLDQKLTGEVANGDIVKTNFYEDYNAVILEENKDKNFIKIELKSKNNKSTYGLIHYVVSNKDYAPISATFFALSGKPLKNATYSELKKIYGEERLTKIRIDDYLSKDKFSELIFSEHKKETFNEEIFNKESLNFD